MTWINPTAAAAFYNLGSLAGYLTSTAAFDVVGVFNQESFEQVFAEARPIRATIRRSAKVMDYPVEDGSVISDHKIINPMELELQLIIPSSAYGTVYNQISQYFYDSTLLLIQTRVDVRDNFIISDLPHQETADMYDSIAMNLRLKEVFLISNPTIFAPTDPNQASTVSRGQVSPKITTLTPLDQTALNADFSTFIKGGGK